ncbi:MAG: UDP-N-acetylmuramate dehydrogenase [Nannocystaceae bacterium]|nr:UDP-N-acetylmuramate dehydrogenase [Nannocystaceae bacterium]
MAIPIEADVPLAPRTTLELGGRAQAFTVVRDEAALIEALAWADDRALPLVPLGGGSNVLVPDEGVAGLVVDIALHGIEQRRDGERVVWTAAAGEPWDAFVAQTVDAGCVGLECLSGIPGRVGATPIQNVGAYGQEVAQTITRVRVLDRRSAASTWVSAAACGFGYRDSRFKREPHAAIVVAVEFALVAGTRAQVRYPELVAALGGRSEAPPHEVRAAVLALRAGKSMLIDPLDDNRRSVGSFFTNPVVEAAVADAVVSRALAAGLVERAEQVPRWPQPGGAVKLAAAWLIERSGIHRGLRRGAVGVSTRHCLALVHHGGGTTAQLLALAEEIRHAVRAHFDVELALEPTCLPRRGAQPVRAVEP